MILIILILAFIIRLVLINQSLWLDEATSALVAQKHTFLEIIKYFSPGDFHPPLYYLILNTWGKLFGYSEISMRFPSILFSIGTIYTVYKICRQVVTKEVQYLSIFSAILCSISPLFIYYSQEARMYSLSSLLTTLLLYLFIRQKSSIAYAVVSILAVYTYYPLIFFLVAIFLYSLFVDHKQIKKTFICLMVTIAVFLPWASILHSQLTVAWRAKSTTPLWWSVLGETNIKAVLLVWIKFIIGRINFYTRLGYLSYIIICSIVPLLALIKSWTNRKQILIIWYTFLTTLFISAVAGTLGSGFSYFRLVFILPLFLILISHGISRIDPSLRNFLATILVLSQLTSIAIFWINPRFHKENWKDGVKFIESQASLQPTVAFINLAQADAYKYYAQKSTLVDKSSFSNTQVDHLWLARYTQPIFDPEDEFRIYIESLNFKKVREKDFNEVVFWEYQK